MRQYAVSAMGADRPGIVAGVGEALLEIDANIEDSSMTILGGQFAMLLVIEAPGALDQVRSALEPVTDHFGLVLEVRMAGEHEFATVDRDDWVIAGYGPDRPGLVTALSRVIADANVNITDFGSRIGADRTFAMWFNVTLPDGADSTRLHEQLQTAGRELSLDVRMYRAAAEEL